MNKNTSVICCGTKIFVVVRNPYVMTVLERMRDGETVKRVYYSQCDISSEDKRDFLLARVVNNVCQKNR